MGNDTMDLLELASFLGRDARELGKLANRGLLPGRKVGGEWRFAEAEIHHWLEVEMPGLDERQLQAIDNAGEGESPLIADLLPGECISLLLPARTRASVLRELVKLAEKSQRIWDPAEILKAIEAREDVASTAQSEGYAIPHPRRRIPNTLAESVIALARVPGGIPFGAVNGELTDLFFLVCCNDDALHLRVLARLARMLRVAEFLEGLRSAEEPGDAWDLINDVERGLSN
jgi:PTS system nitrogen regulatory IIA component